MATVAKVLGIFMAIIFLLAEVMVLCQPPPSPRAAVPAAGAVQQPGFPVTVTGDDGRAVTLAAPPRRIVSLSPGHTEVLYAIGAGALMVGVDEFSDYPPDTGKLPKLAYSNVNLEQLVALDPQLVVAVTRQKAAVPEMEKLGLTVLYLTEAGTVQGILDRVRLLGKVTGNGEQAEQVARSMQGRIAGVQRRLEGVAQGPTVFYELSPELHTAGPDSFIGDILAMLKLRNIAADVPSPFPKLSPEKVIADDPEVVVLADPEAGETPETLRTRPGWSGMRAVRQGRILVIPNRDIIHRPGPRVVEGLEFLARQFYPERFQ
ncbi:MAG: ABC transporter substrate-binding protein [Chloroflexi bacterium]|nr:ABC transporter substrate-binding protein [Chloroflexota bacterium]